MVPQRTTVPTKAAIERRAPVATQRNAVAVAPSPARALQQRLGNRATQALIARSIAAPARECTTGGRSPVSITTLPSIQLSSTTRVPAQVSTPNDPAELEAEETARKVMRMHEPPAQNGTAQGTLQLPAAAPGNASTRGPGAGQISISEPGDAHEREAHRAADVVMRTTVRGLTSTSPSIPRVQRVCADCEEEISTRERAVQPVVAGHPTTVHRSASPSGAGKVSAPVAASIHNMQGGGAPLPAATRAFFEPRFGADFSHVRVHTGARADSTAKAISARAFTVGSDIVFAGGQYSPESHEGQHLLAHELTHVVQQDAGTRRLNRQADRVEPAIVTATHAPTIQRAWYNFDIPFTDYQFDPSIKGVKTAAGIVKDEALRVGGAALECAQVAGRSIYDLITFSLPSLHELLGMPSPVQGSPIGTLDVIIAIVQHPCLRMIPGYTLLASGVKLVQQFYGFLRGAWKVISDPDTVINAIRESMSAMMSPIPDQIRALAQKAITFSDPPKGHLMGIWRHLEPKLEFIGANWWQILKQTAWELVWPWPGVGKDLGEIWTHIKAAGSDIWDAEFSSAVDHLLAVWRTANNAFGRMYGWFFVASVLIGAIIGAFFGGVGALPGAAAGAKFALAVGEGLLISTVAAETASIAKAGFDLVFTEQTEAQNEEDYEQISTSAIVLGITGVMFALGALAARFARGIINRVAGRVWQRPPLRGRGTVSRGDIIEIRVTAATRVAGLLRRSAVTWLETIRRNFPVIDLLEGGQINVVPRPGRAPLYRVTGGRIISVKSTAQLGADAQSAIQGWVDELANFNSVQNVSVTNPTGRTLMVAVQTPLDDATAAAVRTYATGRGVRLEMFQHLPPDHPAVVFPDAIPLIMSEAGVVAGEEATQPLPGGAQGAGQGAVQGATQ